MRDFILATARSNTPSTHPDLDAAAARLHHVIDRLQSSAGGNAALDALIEDALLSLANVASPLIKAHVSARIGARWSDDLGASIGLLDLDYNFSVGQRDGMCWCWIQPNDNWNPQEIESRHDHPAGSGLIVAHTTALAMTTAIILVCTRQVWRSRGMTQ